MMRRGNKAQSFLEYAVLIAVVVGALIAMRIYITRSVQAKFKQGADVFGQGEQYEKGVTQVTNLDDTGTESGDGSGGGSGSGSGSGAEVIYDTCDQIRDRVKALEKEVENLSIQADALEESAANTEEQLPQLTAQVTVMRNQAADFANSARWYRYYENAYNMDADTLQAQLDQLQAEVPECAGAPAVALLYSDEGYTTCAYVGDLKARLAGVRQQAAQMAEKAQEYEGLDKMLRDAASGLESNTIPQLGEQAQDLRQEAGPIQEQIDLRQAEIDKFKQDSPQCFEAQG